VLLPLLVVNNVTVFVRTASFLTDHPELRHDAGAARDERPDDPWPRRDAVQLAYPDIRGFFLGWHAPGGSFSPGFDTFAISIWILDEDGALVATGDDLPLDAIREELEQPDMDQPALAIHTDTPYYAATWRALAPRTFRLELEGKDARRRLALAVRAVGAQPGPLRTLERTEAGLLANGRFAIDATPPARVHLGLEGPPGWIRASSDAARVESSAGWCWARLELAPGPATVEVSDRVLSGFVDTYLFQLGASD
jgi:hypothetical protein